MRRALALAFAALVGTSPAARAVEPVRGFELERYLGTWHEIAAIPTWFQRDCAYATRATYTATAEPDRIAVLNACRTEEGELDRALGRARFTQDPGTAALEVTFVELLGAYRWFAAGDYVVIALDPDYRWSAVAHPSLDYAWILAREPELPSSTLAVIEAAYRDAGYDTCRLLTSPQSPGAGRDPLCAVVAAP